MPEPDKQDDYEARQAFGKFALIALAIWISLSAVSLLIAVWFHGHGLFLAILGTILLIIMAVLSIWLFNKALTWLRESPLVGALPIAIKLCVWMAFVTFMLTTVIHVARLY